jgi:hypothetical protein
VIRVSGGRMGDWISRWVDRKIVERAQHVKHPPGRTRRVRFSNISTSASL